MLRLKSFPTFVVLLISLRVARSQHRDGDYHECSRACDNDASSKKLCRYEFFVSELPASVGNKTKIKDQTFPPKNSLGINGRSPGPRIEACLGDTIEVLLYNRLGTEELSFHWHGLGQKGSPHMDGVPMVTQCSILPFGGFRYKIKPEKPGTYLYYAHSVSQQGDGVYGSLTVRGPRDDPSLERILLLSSRPPAPLSRHSHLQPPTPVELLLNGQGNGTMIKVSHGAQYLLRLINANAFNCPVQLSIVGHDFLVMAIDGSPTEPFEAKHAVLFPGERFDVVLKANQSSGQYLIDVKGFQDCRGLRQEALITYDNAEPESTVIRDEELVKIDDSAIMNKGHDCHRVSKDIACALDLKGSGETPVDISVHETVYIPFDVNTFSSFTDEVSDNRYNFYGCAFYPSYLSVKNEDARVAQINGISFKYPSSPLLSQPENTPEESMCSLEKRSKQCVDTPLYCECIQTMEVSLRKNIEIVLIDEGFGGNASYAFHIHGYTASVVGRGSFDRAISREEIMLLDRSGKLQRNRKNPVQKDSFVVPNKGYVILRLFTDNPGYWLWEARSTGISPELVGPGMQFLLKVGSRETFLPVPSNFPTCGNNKGPDLVFDTN